MESAEIDQNSIDASAHRIHIALDSIVKKIEEIKEKNRELNLSRNQSLIHMAQYKLDFQLLLNHYNKISKILKGPKSHIYAPPRKSSSGQIQSPGRVAEKTIKIAQHGNAEIRSRTYELPNKGASRGIEVNLAGLKDRGDPILVMPKWSVEANDEFYSGGAHIRLKYALRINAVLCTMNFSSDGAFFVFADTSTAFIVKVEDGSVFRRINLRYDQSTDEFTSRCIRFTPDNKNIVVGNDDFDVVLFNIETGMHVATLKRHTKKISSIIFTHKGKIMVTSGFDKTICVWNLEKLCLIKCIEQHDGFDMADSDMIIALAVVSDETYVAVGFANGYLGVYDVDFEQPILTYKAHDSSLMNIAISPFDGTIATGSSDHTVKTWSLHGRLTLFHTLATHKDLIISVAFKPNGAILFSGSKDECLYAWDYKKGELLFKIIGHENTIFDIIHHPIQNKFASCSGDGLVFMWEYDTR